MIHKGLRFLLFQSFNLVGNFVSCCLGRAFDLTSSIETGRTQITVPESAEGKLQARYTVAKKHGALIRSARPASTDWKMP